MAPPDSVNRASREIPMMFRHDPLHYAEIRSRDDLAKLERFDMARLFPGIDPFVEAQGLWPDFHGRTITYSCDFLADSLPNAYLVRMEERISLIEYPPGGPKILRPDLAIERSSTLAAANRESVVLEMEPTTIPFELLEEVREVYIEILHQSARQNRLLV